MALTPPIKESPDRVRELLAPLRHDFSVAVLRAKNPFSIGAILRVAHNFLAREVILIGEAPYYEKAAMGMDKFETIIELATEDSFFAWIGDRPLFAVEKEYATRSLYADRPFPKNVVFVFGSERDGVPTQVIERANEVVGIPIYGVNQSLPVAVAAGIVMSEWSRRHYTATANPNEAARSGVTVDQS